MAELTLNERSYLCDFISKFIPDRYSELWDLSEKITRNERGYLLALCYKRKDNELKQQIEHKLNFYNIKRKENNE